MNKQLYCENVCNYLNNLKGYIEDYEIKNLLWCVFGIEDIENITISFDDTMKLSADISCDSGTDFYNDLCNLFRKVKEN